tara:strand:- start:533 stop:844 length:312 start_codon:yes stop_codon:yes gene_type:complete
LDIYFSPSFWSFLPEFWLILGIVLIISELLWGDMIILPIGVAAIAMSVIILGQENLWFGDFELLENWRHVLIAFAVLSVVSIGLLKYLFQVRLKKKTPDINEY